MEKALFTSIFLFLALLVQPAVAEKAKQVEFLNADKTSELPFSDAVRVGNLLFLSGSIGVQPGKMTLAAGGIQAEAQQTMENIKARLEKYGYRMSDVVKCLVMLADMSEWGEFNKVYTRYFSPPYPARSAFGATGLALGARVEVECIAAVE